MLQHVSLSNPLSFTLSLTIGVAIRLKELGMLDVFALPGSADEFTRIISDEELFPKVLWQMTNQTCDFSTFKSMVANTEQEPLWDKFRDELFAFFHVPTWNEIVSLANAANESVSEKPSWSQNSPTTNEETNDNENLNDHGIQSGRWPEQSGSILADSHIVNSTECFTVESVLSGLAQAG